MNDRPDIIWLDEPGAQSPTLVGNKAATLARLRELGHEVPDGFCVTTAAPQRLTEPLRRSISSALDRLMPPWVVRSSATAEDGDHYAFPGLFKTVLDLADGRSALEAVEAVRHSMSSPAASTYAAHHDLEMDGFLMGVLIQSLVPATVSGVAFSQDPVTGDLGVVIESNYGLGETVVDGSITPDSLTVHDDGRICDRRVGSKKAKVVVTTQGTRIRRLPTSELERSACSITDDLAATVAAVVRRIESELRHPVDIEWAAAGGRVFILQSRPITTLPAQPTTTSGDCE
jgi:phosphoenolpyruvate synthase/pyruvate phosphate dikinase